MFSSRSRFATGTIELFEFDGTPLSIQEVEVPEPGTWGMTLLAGAALALLVIKARSNCSAVVRRVQDDPCADVRRPARETFCYARHSGATTREIPSRSIFVAIKFATATL
jgi:hypothetical protein